MLVETPEIRWHFNEAGINESILSIDFLKLHVSNDTSTIFATAGADKQIKLWKLLGARTDNDSMEIDTLSTENGIAPTDDTLPSNRSRLKYTYSLSGHDRSINCIRFSPNGECLASASDDGVVIVWTRPPKASDDWKWDSIESDKDISRILLNCAHKCDITGISWSPDSRKICSTSVDNRVVVWDLPSGDVSKVFSDHTQFVQGVEWNPILDLIATIGNDRTCRIFTAGTLPETFFKSNKKQTRKPFSSLLVLRERSYQISSVLTSNDMLNENIENQNPHELNAERINSSKHPLFHDDTYTSFYRRLTWTPDGAFLLTPSGIFKTEKDAKFQNSTYIFRTDNLSQPFICLKLPKGSKPSIGVRCSSRVYELRKDENGNVSQNAFNVPYRFMFAIITSDSLIVYDSQQIVPLAVISNIHYADLTDVSWSQDGHSIITTSLDGYCTVVNMTNEETGAYLPETDLPLCMKVEHVSIYSTAVVPPKQGVVTPVAKGVNVLSVRKKRKSLSEIAQEDPKQKKLSFFLSPKNQQQPIEPEPADSDVIVLDHSTRKN